MAIAIGRVLAGLEPLSKKSFNAVFRGEALLEDGSIVRGFIKDLDPRQLANELLVAVLGSRLGVKVPRGALVAVSKDVSNAFSKLLTQTARTMWHFVRSTQVARPSLK